MGNTPLHMAVASRSLSIVRVLEEYNGDATIQNKDGITAIDIALTEEIKDVKLYLMSSPKYKHYEFGSAL